MTLRLIDIRHTATSGLPVDVANNNCVQDAYARLRKELQRVDASGFYNEDQAAPDSLRKAQSDLFAWIKEVRA
jgi:hypothetical protein